ncbi:hypothetical protein DAPPUDRAFT_110156 [Daphnia pulex]|uniref:CUB domain-containing protein n=1 Tax=Daphnia pulex TaxID=6669 RepID=E9H5N5_DAPPU|nr:hypothetical protein DAPPUDRAFT_110156 [Daphnia pulex]|eukprot:EFX72901.1 hypothetical protein DAPPUDRAFT_110156 [Daphnia pulex]
MARAIEIFLSFSLILTTIWACKDGQVDQLTARQGLDEFLNANSYPINPWVFPYYYNIQPRLPFAGYAKTYEGRTPSNRKPSGYFAKVDADDYYSQESRFGLSGLGTNLLNIGLFNNRFTPTWRPFANLANSLEACTSPSGDAGICTPGSVCSLFSGRPSGSCTQGKVCCVNVVNSCGGTVTLNNTYWQSPSTPVNAPSTCVMTVRLDNKLVEQAAPICQIRLDFVSFAIAQPTAGTCTDTFQVGGATTVAPTICGTNAGQHMYLDVPSSATSPTDVQLIFNFAGSATRSWNIKIAMLPCGASYLAPPDCLQYFTAGAGQVKSFNWQDSAAAQQLNNQNYNICFRTELVASGARATQLCVSTCTTTTADVAFFLTGEAAGTGVVGTGADKCTYDFLVIPGGQDQATPFAFNDRYCGGSIDKICTKISPFRMSFGTDGTEGKIDAATATAAQPDSMTKEDKANTGFCLAYQEQA